MKKINRYINHNLKVIVHWLRANRISLNVDQTEIVISTKGERYNKKTKFQDKWPADIHVKTNEVSRSYAR